MSEDVIKIIERQIKHINEVIMSCPLFMRNEFDTCNDHCLVCSICWTLQDRDEKVGKGLSKTLEHGDLSEG